MGPPPWRHILPGVIKSKLVVVRAAGWRRHRSTSAQSAPQKHGAHHTRLGRDATQEESGLNAGSAALLRAILRISGTRRAPGVGSRGRHFYIKDIG